MHTLIITLTTATIMNTDEYLDIARLIQLTDSACPVGSFAFSNGLESAAACNLVYNADTLKEYTHSCALLSAFTDGIAAISAHRATEEGNYSGIICADSSLLRTKMNEEARTMLIRMGRKLAELGVSLIPHAPVLAGFLADIKDGKTHGTYPVAQGVLFASLGINERLLFVAHQYGVINMILSAALRCVRVSHIDTQKILFSLMNDMTALYDEICHLSSDEMHAFAPELDIMASLHEKGNHRMFMS